MLLLGEAISKEPDSIYLYHIYETPSEEHIKTIKIRVLPQKKSHDGRKIRAVSKLHFLF